MQRYNTCKKVFLILEDPEKCCQCDFLMHDDYESYCLLTSKKITDTHEMAKLAQYEKKYKNGQLSLFEKPKQNPYETKPEWCPLRPIEELHNISPSDLEAC